MPSGTHWLYLVLASIGLFTLFVGAWSAPWPGNQATLHFFWLSVAFFGVLTFSFSGRLDLLDWVFYWGDEVAIVAPAAALRSLRARLPRAPAQLGAERAARTLLPLLYLPALLIGGAQAAILRGDRRGRSSRRVVTFVGARARLPGALSHRRVRHHDPRALSRALGHGATAAAMDCLGHRPRRVAVRVRLRAAVRARRYARRPCSS